MKKTIIIKYGELSTKKDNINYFLKILKENIDNLLNWKHFINYDRGRMFVDVDDEYIDKTISVLKKTFGIHEIIVGFIDNEMDFDKICDNVLELIKEENFNTFKVICKRSNKKYPLNSMEISAKVGGYILKNRENIKVDVNNPEEKIYIEIRNSYCSS